MEQVAGTEARTDPLDRRAIGHLLAHEGQCEGFDSPTHLAAQHRAQVKAHSAQHTTGCGSVTVRAGTGYSTAQWRTAVTLDVAPVRRERS